MTGNYNQDLSIISSGWEVNHKIYGMFPSKVLINCLTVAAISYMQRTKRSNI